MTPNTIPTRQALIDWGLRPCQGNDCRILVNPEAGIRYCAGCRGAVRHRKTNS